MFDTRHAGFPPRPVGIGFWQQFEHIPRYHAGSGLAQQFTERFIGYLAPLDNTLVGPSVIGIPDCRGDVRGSIGGNLARPNGDAPLALFPLPLDELDSGREAGYAAAKY